MLYMNVLLRSLHILLPDLRRIEVGLLLIFLHLAGRNHIWPLLITVHVDHLAWRRLSSILYPNLMLGKHLLILLIDGVDYFL